LGDFFEIGTVVKAQGIKGEVRVYPSTDDPARFSRLDAVYVSQKGRENRYALQWARTRGTLAIVKLNGVDDRNAAEALVGAVFKIPPEKALPLARDEYYIRDLLGLAVQTEQGQPLGVVSEVLRTGANDVYEVSPPDGKSFYIPAIKDCVKAVDLPGGIMTIRLMEGLRE